MNDTTATTTIKNASTPSTRDRIYQFLHANPAGVLSTSNNDGSPSGAVIYFAVNELLLVTFVTKKATHKSQNIAANNQVSLTVFDKTDQTSVQVNGTATDISGTPEGTAAFHAMLDHSREDNEADAPPLSKLFAGNYISYALQPDHMQLAVFTPRRNSEPHMLYETIDFAA